MELELGLVHAVELVSLGIQATYTSKPAKNSICIEQDDDES